MRVFLLILILLSAILPSRSYAQNDIVVHSLLSELQRTLLRVRDAAEDADLPPLLKVTLNLQSALKKDTGGKVSLFVIEFGSVIAKESVLRIRLDLEPPGPSHHSPVSSAADLLASAIVQSALAVKYAKSGNPPLHLRKLTATIRFAVSSAKEGGAGFNLLPLTVELGGRIQTVATQELIVEFGE